ncbi:O-antigen ligase family protein [Candidatus Enterovibrio altilux]|uniref:O-antigen ligase n=2 Tax=Candidatus Enterovibrio altilux TaxID=1927128 RepID=A0A291B741_9GAMM|nr:O-antigen ligase family protein [Candidatus Enterovibrio luxaltus]ATF08824.1 O-antigen ligase [Candidatus Enterovibrio luxaltus]
MHIIPIALFFIPGLLLWTPKFSVTIGLLTVIYALFYCFKYKSKLNINKDDFLVFAIFGSYLITNIPITLADENNFRYIDAPSRILLFFPVYLMFKNELPKLSIRTPFEYGIIVGAIGAFFISIYQYYILEMPRVEGFLFSINFGYLACSLAFLNLSFIKGSSRKGLLICGFLCASIATTLTLTRGAIIAIPVLFTLLTWIYRKEINGRLCILGVVFFIFISGVIYSLSSGVQNRVGYTILEFSSIAAGDVSVSVSSGGRLQLWLASIKAFQQSPFIGLTHSEREALNLSLYNNGTVTEWVTAVSRGHAHNQYFEMLASNGILSFITIIMLFGVTTYLLFRNLDSIYSVSGVIFMSGIAIFGLTEVLLHANIINIYFGFFLAFFLASSLYGTKDCKGFIMLKASTS